LAARRCRLIAQRRGEQLDVGHIGGLVQGQRLMNVAK
jgi:hypothetical protein